MSDSGNPQPERPDAASASRNWLRAFAVSTAVFLAGALLGAAFTFGAMHHAGFRGPSAQPGPSPERMSYRLQRRLDLSVEQRVRVQQVFEAQHGKLRQIRQETAPRVLQVLDETQEAVSRVLNESQARVWNEHFSRMRRRHQPEGWRSHMRPEHSGAHAHTGSVESQPMMPEGGPAADSPEAGARKIFDRIDANGDGVIDNAEWERHLMDLLRAEVGAESDSSSQPSDPPGTL